MQEAIEELVSCLRKADQVVLITHIKPDGDALGSLFGLADILRGMGKEVCTYLEEEVPELYRFLPGVERTEYSLARLREFVQANGKNTVVIALDCGDSQRLGKSSTLLLVPQAFISIDHHQGNNGFGDLSWVEPHRSSTGEMICDLAMAMGQKPTPAAATCLYTAIMTDSGSFRYPTATSHTHKVAAFLVQCGAQTELVNEHLYDSYSLPRLRLLQKVLTTLSTFCDDRIALMCVTREMLEETGASLEEAELFINLPRAVKTVQIAVFLREGEDCVFVSLRSRGKCDVSRVALKFGGGGHARASGFRCRDGGVDQVKERLLPVLIDELGC